EDWGDNGRSVGALLHTGRRHSGRGIPRPPSWAYPCLKIHANSSYYASFLIPVLLADRYSSLRGMRRCLRARQGLDSGVIMTVYWWQSLEGATNIRRGFGAHSRTEGTTQPVMRRAVDRTDPSGARG